MVCHGFLYFMIYCLFSFERHIYTEREREISYLLLYYPDGLNSQVEARSFFWVPYMDVGAQALEPFSSTFQAYSGS